jgi:hypothetical protein
MGIADDPAEVRHKLERSRRASLAEASRGAFSLMGLVEPSEFEDVVYELKPRLDGTFRGRPVRTNSLGLGGAGWSPRQPQHVFRVAGLGDSHMFGWGVGQDETYMHLVEQRLNASAAAAPTAFASSTLRLPVRLPAAARLDPAERQNRVRAFKQADGHPSALAHQVLAEVVYDELQRMGVAPRQAVPAPVLSAAPARQPGRRRGRRGLRRDSLRPGSRGRRFGGGQLSSAASACLSACSPAPRPHSRSPDATATTVRRSRSGRPVTQPMWPTRK